MINSELLVNPLRRLFFKSTAQLAINPAQITRSNPSNTTAKKHRSAERAAHYIQPKMNVNRTTKNKKEAHFAKPLNNPNGRKRRFSMEYDADHTTVEATRAPL